ncbi:MAG: hypothetical protein R3C53_17835 [Pirellulaceae bacterium]
MSDNLPVESVNRKQRRLRTFGVTALLVLTLVAAVAVKVWLLPAYLSYQRKLLTEDISRLGGMLTSAQDRVLLRGDSVTDESIEGIAHRLHYIPELQQVDLLDTKVTDAGFTLLTQQHNITRMHVQGATITDEAIQMAREKRPDLDAQRRAPDPIATGLAMTNVYLDAIPVAKFSPIDGQLFFGSGDGGLHRLSREGFLTDDAAHGNWLFDLEFSPNGQLLATAGGDNHVSIWNPRTMRRLVDCVAGENDVHGVVWLNDSQLATAGDDRAIRVWQLNEYAGQLKLEITCLIAEAHEQAIPRIVYDRQHQRLLTASRDNQIGIWQLVGDQLKPAGRLVGHRDDVMAINLSPDGLHAISAGYDGNLIHWDLANQCSLQVDHLVDQRIYAVHVDWRNSQAYVGHHAGLMRYDLNNGERDNSNSQQLVASIAWDDQRLRLATTSADGRITYRNAQLQPLDEFQYEQLFGLD